MDWLAGGDRRDLAIERIYDAAAEVIAARGLDLLNIDDLAKRAGCSRATIYRHVGGKSAIRDAVLARSIARIGVDVRTAVAGLHGSERVVNAILTSVRAVRADPVAASLIAAPPTADNVNRTLTDSPRLAAAAAELAGLGPDDPLAAEWIVRVVLSLLYWPMGTAAVEERAVRRFVVPAFS
ncbi:TetR/AcrR family transcriptional regulator [Mycobacterium hubeiense]|uniref:TetR/AcrR family transcriptional regulator n=1 Tax=Mycobacterium hubeiense TaxID=1867256 RepID=UPI000C7E975A|nr:TetR/AcrR family transcriptional regulator [Mycobacterium sp. QGD 101]